MSVRATVIVFIILFSIGIFAVVILPFVLNKKPPSPGSDSLGANQAKEKEAEGKGVFRSDDGGKTWQQKSWVEGGEGSIASFQVNQIVRDPKDPSTLYLATAGNGLWVSRSRGDLWAKVRGDASGTLEPNANVLAVAVNPDDNKEWYVAVFQKNKGRVLRTGDGGFNFSEIYAAPLERYGVFDVYYDSPRRAVMIATGQGGLLETANQGQTWRVTRWFADGLVRLVVSAANSAVRFVVTPEGSVFRTEDRGKNWADITPAIRGFGGSTLNQRWFTDDFGGIYLGSSYGLLRSRDSGSSFEAPPLIIPPDVLPVLAVAVDPNNSAHVAVSAGGQIYRSKDDGESWEIISGPPGAKKVTHLLFDGKNSDTIYAAAN